jgi:protein ImuB
VRFREAVAAIGVAVLKMDRLEFRQQEMFAPDESREAPRELAALVDRLSNRLGPQVVLGPWLLASAQPEFACHYQPLIAWIARRRSRARRAAPTQVSIPGDRPLYLEPKPVSLSVMSVAPEGPPVRFRLAGRDERIVRAWGPERIETGWWRTRCVRRDYYQVETTGGSRYWLFRELNTGRWYLHGEFA